jgi:hypothetical protein
MISIHPVLPQMEQPEPRHEKQDMSASALGSVNGKN